MVIMDLQVPHVESGCYRGWCVEVNISCSNYFPHSFLCISRAIEKLSGHQFENYSFKISYIPDDEVSSPQPAQRSRRGGHSSREQGPSPGGSSQPKQLDFPLRILVPTQFVGAIIGKEGLTIKNLTKQTQSK